MVSLSLLAIAASTRLATASAAIPLAVVGSVVLCELPSPRRALADSCVEI